MKRIKFTSSFLMVAAAFAALPVAAACGVADPSFDSPTIPHCGEKIKALGDAAGYKAELENSLKGWIHAGEMDYWRVKALRELGRDAECALLIAELRQAIKELETPQPEVINAYAKFAGDNSAMERAAKAREKAGFLRTLLAELE